MFNEIKEEIQFGDATLELSTGKIARQADGAVVVRQGDTMILCTSVSARKVKDGADFFPLTVNYLEKSYAAGRIPGGFLKREGGGRSDREILVSRLIDRPIRPLFDPNFFNETHLVCTVHSYDNKYQPDILSIIGASAALAISGVPYLDIVAASRVGRIEGKFVLNPSPSQMKLSDLDMVVAGTKTSVMMVESEANLLSEDEMLEAVKFAHQGFVPVIEMIEKLKDQAGKEKWQVSEVYPESLKNEIRSIAKDGITKAFAIKSKQERYGAIDEIASMLNEKFLENGDFSELQINMAFEAVKAEVLRKNTLENQVRIDGRKLNEIRDIVCEVGVLNSAHGSSLFTRGETQALVTVTLGTGYDEQIIEDLEGEYRERFLLNYIFPPYSVGEAAALRAPSRREVGHGKLAWRSLSKVIPPKDKFPYTVRIVSEITESNGSSSMATVCGASMAMMNAGVSLPTPIAGIAMGLIKEGSDFVVLSDILGDEDHLGDMDFKVAGGIDGVTALQMDIKVAGITFDIMEKALKQAKDGRIHILKKMAAAISESGTISDNAPLIEVFKVPKEKIREIIGSGGSVIRDICEKSEAKIDISDDGDVSVFAVGREKLNKAIFMVKAIAFDPEVGSVFDGKVVKIIDAGAFVNFYGNRDGFVHISEVAHERINSVSDVLSEGQDVRVKLIGYERGKAKLTIKNHDKEIDLSSSSQNKPSRDSRKPSGDRPAGDKKKPINKSISSKETHEDKGDSEGEKKERKYFN